MTAETLHQGWKLIYRMKKTAGTASYLGSLAGPSAPTSAYSPSPRWPLGPSIQETTVRL